MKPRDDRPDAGSQVAGIVVVYRPADLARTSKLVATLVAQCNRVYLFDNGGVEKLLETDDVRRRLMLGSVVVLGEGRNVGIGKALNDGVEQALKDGLKFLLTFDQDSAIPEDYVEEMLRWYWIVSGVHRVAALGPRMRDSRVVPPVAYPFPSVRRWCVSKVEVELSGLDGCVDAGFIATSGALHPVDVFGYIGPFRADFFIDYVDTEWCLRSRDRGYKVVGLDRVVLDHQLSRSVKRASFGRLRLEYSPTRLYYMYRNAMYMLLRLPLPGSYKMHLALTWVWRAVVWLPGLGSAAKSFRAAAAGAWDGILGRLGPCGRGADGM